MNGKRQVRSLGLLILALALILPAHTLVGAIDAGQVTISEIRIDQPSDDFSEYFELAGAAGTLLDGLTYLVIGDGTGGSGVIEAVVDLAGTSIPASGYYVVAEGTFALGTADLTASLNFENGDNVTHLLVDGFAGTNGQDLDTDDDGVLDSTPWTAVIDLIALVEEENPPSGTEYHYGPPSVGPDGTFVPSHAFQCPDGWQIGSYDPALGSDTPGAANTCPLPELVINEIMQDPNAVGDNAGEWFELYNPTGADIDVEGWTVQDNGSDSFVIANGAPLLVPAGGYLVLGNHADTTTNGGVAIDYEFSGMYIGNSDDELVLIDALGNEIDRVEYDGGPVFPDPTGASMALQDPALDNSDGVNWCTASTPYGAGDLGTPGAANDCGGTTTPPELVINEIMQDPSAVGDSAGEWFELYNPTDADIDVEGWTVQDNGSDSFVIANGSPLIVPAGGYLILGNNADTTTNGGVAVDYEFSGMYVGNSDDELVLIDALGNEIDRVEYDGGPIFPDPTGASMALQNPALDNNDGANWCTASTPYGAGDLGTPGAANDCPLPELVINEIMQDPSAVGDSAGEWFELYNPTDADIDVEGWTVQDNGSDSFVIANGSPLIVPAGGYLILGNNADSGTNGGVAVDYEFSGMYVGNSDDELVLIDAAGNEIDRVEYDGGAVFPDPTGASMALQNPALDNNDGANWCTASTPYGDGDLGTPGAANDCGGGNVCGADATLIHDIQTAGTYPAMVGDRVFVEAAVVGDFQGGSELEGFFLQEEDADADADPATSEGIFVYDPTLVLDVNVGQVVRLEGKVAEYNNMTQLTYISDVQICSDGASVTPASVTLPVSSQNDLEPFEGMQVQLAQELAVSENYSLGRYGELVLSNGRLFNPTNIVLPGAPAIAQQAANDLNRIVLDDGSTNQNPDPIIHPAPELSALNSLRGGDTVQGIDGVLTYAFGAYRVHPIAAPAFVDTNARTAAPDPVGGTLKVASLNVLNYFTTIDTGPDICGPEANLDCRGANSEEEFARQRAKVVAALAGIDADIVGLVEIENNETAAIQDLVNGVNDRMGAGTYAYVEHRHDRNRRHQGRSDLQAGHGHAVGRLCHPGLDRRSDLYRHQEPACAGTDLPGKRHRGPSHRCRQPPEIQGL